MLILPGALPVAPTPEQAFAVPSAPSPAKTVTPVSQSEKTRNDTGQQMGQQTSNQNNTVLEPLPNPDEPVGPTPAFEANLLESEREKLRAGPPVAEPAETENPDQVKPDEAEADKATAPEQYAKAPEPETHAVDITL